MHRLKGAYTKRNAIIILGGPSILENKYDLSLLSKRDDIIFLESKALTPKFIEYGVVPDYYMMPYPEKSRTNTLQQNFMQAISCGFELSKCLKDEYVDEWNNFKDRFGDYAEIWRIEYPHKRYRIKKEVVLNNSPLSLLNNFPNMRLITYDKAFERDGISAIGLPNDIYKYTHSEIFTSDLAKYFNPEVIKGRLNIESVDFVNSAAISIYPLLNYMGFSKIVFIGMDMSYLGALEFSSLYTFKSMHHFKLFFNATRQSFAYKFPKGLKNGLISFGKSFIRSGVKNNIFKDLHYDLCSLSGKFMREEKQVLDCKKLFNNVDIEFLNIYQKFKYSQPIPGATNIHFNKYFQISH